ncbi:MAG: response regulator [Candidatus Krumholzibacteriota bacterium]|nr:response regulator [Candidatus Krumholzibacteriota bacterium]
MTDAHGRPERSIAWRAIAVGLGAAVIVRLVESFLAADGPLAGRFLAASAPAVWLGPLAAGLIAAFGYLWGRPRPAVADAAAVLPLTPEPSSTRTRAILETRKESDAGEIIIETQKLEASGALVGGITHDFNNLLATIMGNVSLAQLHADDEGELAPILADLEKAALKARKLTRQLQALAGNGPPSRRKVPAGNLVTDSAELALHGSNISCHYSVSDGLWPVEVEESLMRQALSNIVMNARESSPEGGRIHIDVDNLHVALQGRLPVGEGNWCRIVVRDRGHGIPRENIVRIFDPNFTTKEKGSGLGLPAAWTILRRHGGHIEVDSTPGEGTAVTIYLPASPGVDARPPVVTSPVPGGRMKILVMDDDDLIRKVLGKLLDNFGYAVEFAGRGEDAVELWRRAIEAGSPFDVAILDLTVAGGMGARSTLEELRRIDPGVRAIVTSGYGTDPIMQTPKSFGFRGSIPKPYRAEDLQSVLGAALKKE